jgi:hypothetical protein
MTQLQLDRSIAALTGEPIRLVRQLGFSVLSDESEALEPEDFLLVLNCPFCDHPAPYPDPAGDGTATLAECDRCDVYFDYEIDEVYPLATKSCAGSVNVSIDGGRISWLVAQCPS